MNLKSRRNDLCTNRKAEEVAMSKIMDDRNWAILVGCPLMAAIWFMCGWCWRARIIPDPVPLCAIEEEFRPDDAPSEEECHAWQELERIRAKNK